MRDPLSDGFFGRRDSHVYVYGGKKRSMRVRFLLRGVEGRTVQGVKRMEFSWPADEGNEDPIYRIWYHSNPDHQSPPDMVLSAGDYTLQDVEVE